MARKRKKVSAKTLLKRLHKKADSALSLYVREMAKILFDDKCPFCKRDPLLLVPSKDGTKMRKNGWVCFHFIRRRRKGVRWVLANVIGACAFCNRIEVGNPDVYRGWLIRNRGVKLYLELIDRSEQRFEPTIEYLQGIIDLFTARLKELKAVRSNG